MAKKKNRATNPQTLAEKELGDIKKLLMLFLVKTGVTQDELALALKIDRAEISRALPTRKIKKYKD